MAQRVSVFAVPSICSLRADRIDAFREMICSDTVEEREEALGEDPSDAAGRLSRIFMRLLKGIPGYHPFPWIRRFTSSFPHEEADIEALAKAKGKTVEEIKNIINSLHEFNPMMGHRGCRLAVTYPEIAKMQTRAVIQSGYRR